jgi:hypothetical protein
MVSQPFLAACMANAVPQEPAPKTLIDGGIADQLSVFASGFC